MRLPGGRVPRILSCIALLVTVAACSNPKGVILGRVYGTVTIDGVGTAGIFVTLSLGDRQRGQLLTGEDGDYNFFGTLEPGSYRVTISGFPGGVTFPETTQVVQITSNSEVEVNFAGSTS